MNRVKRSVLLTYMGAMTMITPGIVNAANHKIAFVNLDIPSDYHMVSSRQQEIPSPIPGAKATIESYAIFHSDKKGDIHLFVWQGDLPRDLGPMKSTASWPVKVDGIECEMAETSIFMGLEQKVAALFCPVDDRGRLMLYSPELSADDIRELLANISIERH